MKEGMNQFLMRVYGEHLEDATNPCVANMNKGAIFADVVGMLERRILSLEKNLRNLQRNLFILTASCFLFFAGQFLMQVGKRWL